MAVQYNKLWKLLIDKKDKAFCFVENDRDCPLYYGEAGQG